jgi:AbrB family looped-hinge helix DNA binding protein
MIYPAKITSKGQTTIPVELRERLGLKTGDRIRFVTHPDGMVTVEKDTTGFETLRGLIKMDQAVSGDQIEAWIAEARDAIGSRK